MTLLCAVAGIAAFTVSGNAAVAGYGVADSPGVAGVAVAGIPATKAQLLRTPRHWLGLATACFWGCNTSSSVVQMIWIGVGLASVA